MLRQHYAIALIFQGWLLTVGLPTPFIAKPGLRQRMDGGRLRAAVMDRHPHQQIVRPRLGVLDLDIEVAVIIEKAGIDQLEFHRRRTTATCIFIDQPLIGKRRLRQLVEHPRISIARDGIKIIIELLDVLAMAALAIGKTIQPLLQDGIFAIPQRNR